MTVRGILYIISAPSGAGKTTLVHRLVAQDEHVRISISHTTRMPRMGEQEAKDYYFVDLAQFNLLKAQGCFVETAQVFGCWYGTSRDWLDETLALGFDVILEIDWQGARRVREIFSCVSVFILPPSKAILLGRLQARAQDDARVIAQRMQQATNEMVHYSEYDYVIINDDVETALGDLSAIVRSERKKMIFQRERYAGLISELISE